MIKQCIDAAANRVKADIVLRNASYVNVFTGRFCLIQRVASMKSTA